MRGVLVSLAIAAALAGCVPPAAGGGGGGGATSYSYYRLNITESNGAFLLVVADIALRTSPAGPTVATGGVATASASDNATDFGPDKAFDGSQSTYWYVTHGGTFPEWLQYELPAAEAVVEYTVEARDNDNQHLPRAWTFLGSNDGVAWDELDARSDQTGWATGEVRTFTITP